MEWREEREIRVFDLFLSICQRWRSLLICLLIGAVILGAYGWYKSGSSSAEPVKKECTEEDWEEVLGPDEIYRVRQLYQTMQEYEALLKEQEYVTDLSVKLENMEHITAAQNHIANVRNSFSDDQRAYLSFLQGNHTMTPGDDTTYSYKDNMESEKEAQGGRRIRPKFVLAGALLGLIIAIIVILIKYIASALVRGAEETEDTLGLPVLGRFDGSTPFYDKRRTALDRWLRKLKQKNKNKTSYEETTDVIAARIQIASKKQEFKNFCIAVDSNVYTDKVKEKDFLDVIAKKANGETEVFIVQNILGNPEAIQRISEADGALIVLQAESSRFMDVQYERLLCDGYEIPVIGAVVVE